MIKGHLSIVCIVLLIIATACKGGTKKSEEAKDTVGSDGKKEFVTRSGKKFVVETDRSLGASIVGLKVYPKGFEKVNEVHDFGTVDPIADIFLEDIDGNGYEELYIVTRSVGSGSYASIYALASNRDRSATPIYVRPFRDEDGSEQDYFTGFMGHNSFERKAGKLLHTFPVYKEGDTNAKPGGGTRRIEYRLVAGEAGWILEPGQIID